MPFFNVSFRHSCHPIDTEVISLKASISCSIFVLFCCCGLSAWNFVCGWMWMWKYQCHFSFTASPSSTRPACRQYHMLNYVLYHYGEKVQCKLFFIIVFAWNWCTSDRAGRKRKHGNRAPKHIEISTTICRFVSIDRINSKLKLNKNEAFNQSNSEKYLRCMKMIYPHEQRQRTRKQMCSLFFYRSRSFSLVLSRIRCLFSLAKNILDALKAFNHCKSAGKIKQNERIESGE